MGALLQADSLVGGYVAGLLQAVLALAVVAALAYLTLRFVAPRAGLFGRRGTRLAVEESLRLDARSSLLIVQVEGRRLLVATHSQAGATLLTELDAPPVLARASENALRPPEAEPTSPLQALGRP